MEKRNLTPLKDILQNKSEKPASKRQASGFCDLCISSRPEGACELQTSVNLQVAQGNVSWARELPKMPQFEECDCPYMTEVREYLNTLKG